ncbi:MAG: MipA/OmpV family protein [Mariprofundaceae bacterium]|nr:MipA/OmpV family protein [Mariprofundaceae bacterium]
MKEGPTNILYLMTLCLSLTIYTTTTQAQEEKKALPLWEMGLAAGVFSIPHYVGSDQRYTLPLAAPYIVYRGDIIRADSDGLRGRLFDKNGISLDLDFSFGLPVKSSNRARQGMPDINLVGQVGPQINVLLEDNNQGSLSIHLPWRFAMDTSPLYLGWVIEPSVRYKRYDLLPELHKMTLRIEAGLLYASQHYNHTYYGVDPIYATANRPTYQAKQGMHSYFADTSLHYNIDNNLSIAAVVRMRSLAGSVNRNSPLIRQNYYFSAGIAMVWSFVFSDETVWR